MSLSDTGQNGCAGKMSLEPAHLFGYQNLYVDSGFISFIEAENRWPLVGFKVTLAEKRICCLSHAYKKNQKLIWMSLNGSFIEWPEGDLSQKQRSHKYVGDKAII